MFKIKKNDTVMVCAGKDRGKKGKVLSVIRDKNRAVVEGINFIKRHTRRTREDQQGGIVQREAAVHISNLMLFCNKCNKRTRVGFTLSQDGSKARMCKRCHEVII